MFYRLKEEEENMRRLRMSLLIFLWKRWLTTYAKRITIFFMNLNLGDCISREIKYLLTLTISIVKNYTTLFRQFRQLNKT